MDKESNSYREITDIKAQRVHLVDHNDRIISSRDFDGNLYDAKGKRIGHIDN